MASEEIDRGLGEEPCDVLLFTLDGVTYRMVEDPDDGYRSYCDDLTVSEKPPRYSFPPVRVVCSMMENTGFENNECIVMRDVANGKVILEAGTKNYDDWYPYCHFSYTPENMDCNQ
ncbi:MAG: hypothetical protein [Caudoviricetes sp.]|nr:MAG: hypothetical protein [Caudoviricetes sp.]